MNNPLHRFRSLARRHAVREAFVPPADFRQESRFPAWLSQILWSDAAQGKRAAAPASAPPFCFAMPAIAARARQGRLRPAIAAQNGENLA